MTGSTLDAVKKAVVVFAGFIVAAAAILSLVIQRRASIRGCENEALLERGEKQLLQMARENQRLSNQVAQATAKRAQGNDHTAELARLRTEAESLRQKSLELSQQAKQSRQSAGAQFFLSGDFNLLDHNEEIAITFGGGPRASGKLNDARALTAALRKYAEEHQGEFPRTLEAVTPYLPQPLEPDSPSWLNDPLTGTNDFELVFQGTQKDLTNIPPRRVALIRETQPWLTADGRVGRVYGFADGAASTVLSDDNFQSWDAQHIVPSGSDR